MREFLREIKDSQELESIFNIPEGLKNKKVEVIVLPYNETKENLDKLKNVSLRGSLSKYKNKDLYSEEKEAWSKAVRDKYENS